MILRSVCYNNNNNNTEWVWVGCFYSACFNSEGSLDDFCELSCDFPLQYMQHGAGMGLEGCRSRVCGTGVGTDVGFSTDVFPWSERQWGKTRRWMCDAVAVVGSDAIRSSPNLWSSSSATRVQLWMLRRRQARPVWSAFVGIPACSSHAKRVAIIPEHIQLACCIHMLKNPP